MSVAVVAVGGGWPLHLTLWLVLVAGGRRPHSLASSLISYIGKIEGSLVIYIGKVNVV